SDGLSFLLLKLLVDRPEVEWFARILNPLFSPRFRLWLGRRLPRAGRAFWLLFFVLRRLRIQTPERGGGTVARLLGPLSGSWQDIPTGLVPLFQLGDLDDEIVLVDGPIYRGDCIVEDFKALAEL